MAKKTVVSWQEGMTFKAEIDGHSLVLDADEQFGGKNRGPKPKSLLLPALAGCTGMDVVSLLKKMKMEWSAFQLEVEGELGPDHPQVFTRIHVRYIFRGNNLDREKIEKAVALSQEKYCGVSAMLSKTAQITTEVVLSSNESP